MDPVDIEFYSAFFFLKSCVGLPHNMSVLFLDIMWYSFLLKLASTTTLSQAAFSMYLNSTSFIKIIFMNTSSMIFAKVHANRPKLHIGEIIHEDQSYCVPGRTIYDYELNSRCDKLCQL